MTGIKYKSYPTQEQTKTFNYWMACCRVMWNAKCTDQQYQYKLSTYYNKENTEAKKEYPPITHEYSKYRIPFMDNCPSPILRNTIVIWYNTMSNFLKKKCGKPHFKSKKDATYLCLTKELFYFEHIGDTDQYKLIIGTKTNQVGELILNWDKKKGKYKFNPTTPPNSIWIKVSNRGMWTCSFSYEDRLFIEDNTPQDHLNYLKTCTHEQLEQLVTGVDRGVARPAQSQNKTYKPKTSILAKQKGRDNYLKRSQRKLSRQKKDSNRRARTLSRIQKLQGITANTRKDVNHKISREIVNETKVIILEDLKIKNMTKKPKAKFNEKTKKWERNGARAKAGLNRSLLGVGLYMLETFITYKAEREGKPVFKIDPKNTSRECAACGYIHPKNRVSQSEFCCMQCGHKDNADRNAAIVIKKRAINLILHPRTGLSGRLNNKLVLFKEGQIGTDAKSDKTTPKGVARFVCQKRKSIDEVDSR